MRGYNKLPLWKFGVIAALFFFESIEAGVVAVAEEDLGGYMKLVKRVQESGDPVMHLDLHERWHDDHIDQALKKRGDQDVFKLLPEPTPEEKDMFRDSFTFSCGNPNVVACTTSELQGAAMTIMSRDGHYELQGWNTPGIIALGNQAKDPKRYETAIPIHCLSGNGRSSLIMAPSEANIEFRYGVSFSRRLIARLVNTLSHVCVYETMAPYFSLQPKADRLKFVKIQAVRRNCGEWVNPLCKSTDDESKAECLAIKSLLGIPWTETKPTPTKPSKAKK